jgi:seryl-tRNA synthetase
MLDINFIKQNKDRVAKAIEAKGISLELDKLLKIAQERSELILKIDQLRSKQNEFNKKIVSLKDEEKAEAISGMKAVSDEIKELEERKTSVELEYDLLMYLVPNIPSSDSPVGGEEANEVVETWGEEPKFDFEPKTHVELARDLDLVDFDKGVKTSGFRGYYLKNEAAILHLAV